MKQRLFGVCLIAAAAIVIGSIVGTSVKADESSGSEWYKVAYFPDSQTSCTDPGTPCCSEAYIPTGQVDMCATEGIPIVRVAPSSVGGCCGCSHDFCIQITLNTPKVTELPSNACVLTVLACYEPDECGDCIGDT